MWLWSAVAGAGETLDISARLTDKETGTSAEHLQRGLSIGPRLPYFCLGYSSTLRCEVRGNKEVWATVSTLPELSLTWKMEKKNQDRLKSHRT